MISARNLKPEWKKLMEGKCEHRKNYREIAPNVLREIRRLRRKPKGRKRLSFDKVAAVLIEQGYVNFDGVPSMEIVSEQSTTVTKLEIIERLPPCFNLRIPTAFLGHRVIAIEFFVAPNKGERK
jgi:hypothetical protein